MSDRQNEFVLLAASAVSSFGSALSFIVIALILKDSYGVSSISYGFLIQTLPAILLFPRLLALVVGSRRKYVYQTLLILLGINVLSLCLSESIFQIYLYLLVSSVLSAISAPVVSSLIGDWIGVARLSIFQTRVHSLRLVMWAIAPVFGATLFSAVGSTTVFLLDAVSFFIAALLISLLCNPEGSHVQSERHFSPTHEQSSILSDTVKDGHLGFILVWYALSLSSCVLNGVEFAVFELAALSERQIGFALGAWGCGGLLTLWVTSCQAVDQVSTSSILVVLLTVSMLFTQFSGLYLICMCMLLMGIGFSIISGRMRQAVERSLRNTSKSMLLWGHIQQRTAVVSLFTYCVLGFLLSNELGIKISMKMLPVSLLCLLYFQIRAVRGRAQFHE